MSKKWGAPPRVFIHEVMCALVGHLDIEVDAPNCVDVILRKKGSKRMVHLINRTMSKTQEVPRVGPGTIMMKLSGNPKKVRQEFEDAGIKWDYAEDEILRVDVPNVHIHTAILVEE
jgi:hypothetical protein